MSPEQIDELARGILQAEAWRTHLQGPWLFDDGVAFPHPTKGRPGVAPAHHPRRCRGVSTMNAGNRCKRWALPGRNLCKKHGGLRPAMRLTMRLPEVYERHLRPTLAAKLQEFLTVDRTAQLELYKEIALSRTFLCESLDLLMAIEGQEGVPPDVTVMARQQVRSATEHVADLVSRMSRIEKDLEDKVTVRQLGFFVEQITRLVHERLGDSEVARQLADDLQNRLRLPMNDDDDPRVPLEVVVKYD